MGSFLGEHASSNRITSEKSSYMLRKHAAPSPLYSVAKLCPSRFRKQSVFKARLIVLVLFMWFGVKVESRTAQSGNTGSTGFRHLAAEHQSAQPAQGNCTIRQFEQLRSSFFAEVENRSTEIRENMRKRRSTKLLSECTSRSVQSLHVIVLDAQFV